MRLNIGCGDDYREGYINIDCRQLNRVDKVIDIRDVPHTYTPGGVDEIIANDVLEHFGHQEIETILGNLHTVLRVGGVLHIRVPDVDHHINQYRDGHYTADDLSYWLYSAQDYETNYHKMCFNYASLCRRVQRIGFDVSEKQPAGINFSVTAVKR